MPENLEVKSETKISEARVLVNAGEALGIYHHYRDRIEEYKKTEVKAAWARRGLDVMGTEEKIRNYINTLKKYGFDMKAINLLKEYNYLREHAGMIELVL